MTASLNVKPLQVKMPRLTGKMQTEREAMLSVLLLMMMMALVIDDCADDDYCAPDLQSRRSARGGVVPGTA